MKNLILLIFMLFAMTQITGCGKDSSIEVRYEDREVIVEVPVAQDFEGYYLCSNNSTLELLADYNNRVTFETSGQSLNSENIQNPGNFGTHPVISDRDLIITQDKLNLAPRNYNYSSSSHDLEEDVSGSNITGNHRTDRF